MADLLTPTDVADRSNGALQADDPRLPARVADAVALAQELAPCLVRDGVPAHKAQVAKGILADAIVRLVKRQEANTDPALEQQTAGPFAMSVDTRQRDGLPLLTRAEEARVKTLCGRRAGSFRLRKAAAS